MRTNKQHEPLKNMNNYQITKRLLLIELQKAEDASSESNLNL